jgi:hypothetical protein
MLVVKVASALVRNIQEYTDSSNFTGKKSVTMVFFIFEQTYCLDYTY